MKHFSFEGKNYDKLPDPCKGVSPMTEERFVELGGIIFDDGESSPKERVHASFTALIADLAQETDAIAPEEFLAAARNGISSDLISLARSHGVPEPVIAEGRTRIVEIMADALRFGMTWTELVDGTADTQSMLK